MDRVPAPLHQPQPLLRHARAAQEEGAAQPALRALTTRHRTLNTTTSSSVYWCRDVPVIQAPRRTVFVKQSKVTRVMISNKCNLTTSNHLSKRALILNVVYTTSAQ